ncbi:MAG: hypothetical protein QOJ29_1080 [Thermoleophilaceae bacterium]|jgi:hypothetical protein|nr:hypothetical protein [Thermoleophilaceae bacterium]
MRCVPIASAVLAVSVSAGIAVGHPVTGAPGCTILPAKNPWNQRVDKLPLVKNSAAMVRAIGSGGSVHADFGSGLYEGAPIGIPYTTVGSSQKKVKVGFEYSDESDKGPYPVPASAPIEGGRGSDGDRHVIVVDRDACKLYELYAAYPQNGGKSWKAGSGAIWSLNSNKLRPAGWTSADAAGLPILPGLARYEDLQKGGIDHALRFTANRTRKAYIYPARHFASSLTDKDLPAMGQRLRLKKSFNVNGFPKQARAVLTALKTYGMILADNGSSWFISGSPNKGWSNDDLHSLGKVKGSDFEVVDTSKLPRP